MTEPLISSVNISDLKTGFSFDGEFLVLPLNELAEIFHSDSSFKINFYVLILADQGTGSVMIDHEIIKLKKGRAVFVNYHQILRFFPEKEFSGDALLFTQSFYNLIYTGNRKIKSDTAFSQLPDFADFNKPEQITLKSGITEIRKEFLNARQLSKEIICLLLKVVMLAFIRKTDRQNYTEFKTDRKNAYIENFKNLVEQHFKEMKRTSDYAAGLSVSANYLNSLIKEKLQCSAERFIQNRVILEAERLLLNTDLSVTEISFELGFSDNSHFGKYFKKINGQSPNQFRKSFQNNTSSLKKQNHDQTK